MDLDLDNSSKCSAASMTSTEQMELSSPVTCGTGKDADMTVDSRSQTPMDLKVVTGQDADMIEDSCSQDVMDLEVVTGQDADMIEDSCSQDLMDLKVVTEDDESGTVYMSETPEKGTSFITTLRELEQGTEQLSFSAEKLYQKDDNEDGSFVKSINKVPPRASFPEDDLPAYNITEPTYFFETELPVSKKKQRTEQLPFSAEKLDEKDDNEDGSFVKSTNKDSPRASSPEDDLTACNITEPTDFETKVEERNESNFKKFSEDTASGYISCDGKKSVSELRIKPNSETAKILAFSNKVKISATLSKLKRSSAPSSFSNETMPRDNPEIQEFLRRNFSKSKDEDISKDVPESRKTTSISENSKSPFSIEIDKSFLGRVPDTNQSKSFAVFKEPAIPERSCKITKTKTDSPGTPESLQVLQRPTDLNVKMREKFFTFSPNSGKLEQRRSLPNIGRPKGRFATQRRSLNYEEHSRVNRLPFPTESESSTSETRMSTSTERYSVGGTKGSVTSATSLEVIESCSKKSSRAIETSDSTESKSNPESKICRKLNFSSNLREKIGGIKAAEKTANPVEESLAKRKGISPTVIKRFATFVKKVRTSTESEEIDEDTSEDMKVENPVEESPAKRKGISPTVIERLSTFVKKVRTLTDSEEIDEDTSEDVKAENILSSEEKPKNK